MAKAKVLQGFVSAMGYACVAIGLALVLLGRFFGAIFAGYGLAWLWAARQKPIPAAVVRWLAGMFLLGAFGRLLSLAVHGWPHWFQVVLAVVELGLSPLLLWLADAKEKSLRAAARGSSLTTRELFTMARLLVGCRGSGFADRLGGPP